jgi:hypothetical protein
VSAWGRTLGTSPAVRPRHSEAWYVRSLRRDWPRRHDNRKGGAAATRSRIFVATVQVRRLRDEAACG